MVGSKILNPNGSYKIFYKDGDTNDIIKVVMEAIYDPKIRKETAEFAKGFAQNREGLQKLWNWTKQNITYLEDPDGFQWVKDPSRTYAERKKGTDCKSFTVSISAVLQNMGVEHEIWFVSYGGRIPTHVYPVAYLDGQRIVMDAVYIGFDREKKPISYKKTFRIMPEIARLGSVQSNDIVDMSDGDFLRTVYADMYGGQVARDIRNGHSSNPTIQDFLNKTAVMNAPAIQGVGNILDAAKKKILTAILTLTLPAAAPFFLFHFLKKANSPQVAAKKAKQQKILNWIAQNTGMGMPKIEAILRNGIFKKMKKQPEQILAAAEKGVISGVGAVPFALIGVVLEIIQKIAALFKKKDAPAATVADGSDLSLLKQNQNQSPGVENQFTTPSQNPNPQPNTGWKIPMEMPNIQPSAIPSPAPPSSGKELITVPDDNGKENPNLLETGKTTYDKWYQNPLYIGAAIGGAIIIGGVTYYFYQK